MSWFSIDTLLQGYVNVICNEGRGEELITMSDFHHPAFASIENAIDCMVNFGEFIGRFHWDKTIWRFTIPDNAGSVYFIGTKDDVRNRIYEIL